MVLVLLPNSQGQLYVKKPDTPCARFCAIYRSRVFPNNASGLNWHKLATRGTPLDRASRRNRYIYDRIKPIKIDALIPLIFALRRRCPRIFCSIEKQPNLEYCPMCPDGRESCSSPYNQTGELDRILMNGQNSIKPIIADWFRL